MQIAWRYIYTVSMQCELVLSELVIRSTVAQLSLDPRRNDSQQQLKGNGDRVVEEK